MKRRMLLAIPAFWSVPPAPDRQAALLRLFSRPDRALAFGQAYLDSLPTQPTCADLVAAICSRLSNRGSLAHQVATLIRADFAAERIESVQDWLLSRTEARLCALAVLAS